jgi:hypothetical protein
MPEWSTRTQIPWEELDILLKNWYNNRPVRIPKVGIHMMVTFRPVASHGVAYRAGQNSINNSKKMINFNPFRCMR